MENCSDAELAPDEEVNQPEEQQELEEVEKIQEYHISHDNIKEPILDENSKGYAIIFNHENFKTEKTRTGTEKDVFAFTQALNKYNIQVDEKKDFTLEQIIKQVNILKKFDFSSMECFIIAIFTHGNENETLCAWDKTYNLREIILHPIAIENKDLMNIPKIFLIQACKGNIPIIQLREGFKQNGIAEDNPMEVEGEQNGVHDAVVTYESDAINTIVSIAQTYIAFSTYEGEPSYRHPNEGGIFIQSFCQILLSHGEKNTIDCIMQMVTATLILKKAQVSCAHTTLTRPFIFGYIGKNNPQRNQRGCAIIFNLGQTNYDKGKDNKGKDKGKDVLTQCGTLQDVKLISEMCKKYFIDVLNDNDTEIKKTLQEIKALVEKLKEVDFTQYDFLLITIISFITSKNCIHAYDGQFNLFKTIIEPFYKIKALKGKPIIIFVEAMKFPVNRNFEIQIPREMKNIYFALSTYKAFYDKNFVCFGGVFLNRLFEEIKISGFSLPLPKIMESIDSKICFFKEQNILKAEFYFGRALPENPEQQLSLQ